MSLVYNEIIEINCFKLSENTKRNIMKRAAIENYFIENGNALISNDENDENHNNDNKEMNLITNIN